MKLRQNFLILLMILISYNATADVCDDLRNELKQAISKVPSPGGVLYAKLFDGKVCSVNVGELNIRTHEAMSESSPLKAWSIGKTFTHMAILKLVQAGAIRLDQTLSEFERQFPDFYQGKLSSYPKSDKIKILHLISHTSGIVDYMTLPKFMNNWQQTLSPGEVIEIAARNQDDIQPGQISRYSNTTMMILGRIIEVVTKRPYENYIESNFISQLALKNTRIVRASESWGPVYGYRGIHFGPLKFFIDVTRKVSPSLTWATGAIISTPGDLVKWFSSIVENSIFSSEFTSKIFEPVRLNDGSDAEYGLGFRIQRFSNGFTLWGHGGGPLEGNSATMLYSSDLKTHITVMINGSSKDANVVIGSIGWARAAKYLQNKN